MKRLISTTLIALGIIATGCAQPAPGLQEAPVVNVDTAWQEYAACLEAQYLELGVQPISIRDTWGGTPEGSLAESIAQSKVVPECRHLEPEKE